MSTRFGWCITSQRSECIAKIDWNGGVLCDCSCHPAVDSKKEPEGEADVEDHEGTLSD